MQGRPRIVVAAALLLALPLLSGCIDAIDDYEAFDPDVHYKNPVVPPGDYSFANGGSKLFFTGPYLASEPETVYLVSTLPAIPDPTNGQLTQGNAFIPMAIWRPSNVTGKVPIIMDAGPYYEQDEDCGQGEASAGRECTIADAQQRTQWLIDTFLPWGYAIVQLAVRGTGTAGGCMDLLGNDETHDIVQAIDWLTSQEWSNGNVGMIGASYDGSTQWSVAATGNEHLKAIVPTASLPDIFDLMFHNGSAESRGMIMHSLVYWGFGFDDDFPQNPGVPLPPGVAWPIPPIPGLPHSANGRTFYQDLQNLCPAVAQGTVLGPVAAATGERLDEVSDYWTQRDHRPGVLANYKGGIFLLHGLQDWNVDPHATIPYNQQLRDAGIDVTEWYGQWDHAYPDSTCAKGVPEWAVLPCRLDFAQVLLGFFDRHLKGDENAPRTWPVQVQDNVGFWRMADEFPPANPDWLELRLDGAGALRPNVEGETRIQLLPPLQGVPSAIVELKSDPFLADTRISGLPQVKLPFEAGGPGGEVAFWLFDEDADGKVRSVIACQGQPGNPSCDVEKGWGRSTQPALVGHGSMNLRYFQGGETAQTLVAGQRYVAQLEFEPLEVLVPAGHRLTLWLFQGAYYDHQATNDLSGVPPQLGYTPSPITLLLGNDAILRLPTIPTDPTKLFPVPGAHFPTRDNMTLMYTFKPVFQPSALPVPGLPPVPPLPVGDAAVNLPALPCLVECA